MENKEIQEIKVEKELPKTLEEFAIKEIQDLRQEVEKLKEENKDLADYCSARQKESFFWEKEYKDLVKNLKEDLKIDLVRSMYDGCEEIRFGAYYAYNGYSTKEKYKYYKEAFDLKEPEENKNEEKGEEDNE